jgi:hypothetical protein
VAFPMLYAFKDFSAAFKRRKMGKILGHEKGEVKEGRMAKERETRKKSFLFEF